MFKFVVMVKVVSSDVHKSIMSMLDNERGKDRLQRVSDRHIRARVFKEFVSNFAPIKLG